MATVPTAGDNAARVTPESSSSSSLCSAGLLFGSPLLPVSGTAAAGVTCAHNENDFSTVVHFIDVVTAMPPHRRLRAAGVT